VQKQEKGLQKHRIAIHWNGFDSVLIDPCWLCCVGPFERELPTTTSVLWKATSSSFGSPLSLARYRAVSIFDRPGAGVGRAGVILRHWYELCDRCPDLSLKRGGDLVADLGPVDFMPWRRCEPICSQDGRTYPRWLLRHSRLLPHQGRLWSRWSPLDLSSERCRTHGSVR